MVTQRAFRPGARVMPLYLIVIIPIRERDKMIAHHPLENIIPITDKNPTRNTMTERKVYFIITPVII
jgi:hypothetical protein